MAAWSVRRKRWTTLAHVLVALACLSSSSFGVKVDGRSLNVTNDKVENDESNEIIQLAMSDSIDNDFEKVSMYPTNNDDETSFENMEIHPHAMDDKPTKFDLDISDMIHTDHKNLHQAEAQRLGNSMENQTVDKMNRADEVEECTGGISMACIKEGLVELLEDMDNVDAINVTESLQIVKTENATYPYQDYNYNVGKYDILEKVHRFAKNHVLRISMPNEIVAYQEARTFFGATVDGKNPFLTGFGLGFLAFGLKKLLFPLLIGAKLIKSVLIALLLPSLIGSLGKIVGKEFQTGIPGLSTFAQTSQGATAQPEENFEFKDNSDLYNEDYMTRQPLGTLPAAAMYDENMMSQAQKPEIASRFSFVDPRITKANSYSDQYYTRHVANNGFTKKQDFKVFHEIPTSSLLLTNYDPFYSPLLSRLDAVFSRLGHTTEGCREFAVCAMYRSPARYAPYSNLVSAQLSRELNELRRPSSDNPDVLRFFRYMKAAKDGQDGVRCENIYAACEVARDDPSLRQNQAMLATYQDIDKLVHARKI